MYKSLTKTKKTYSELEAHETLKRVASANAIIKHYKRSSLITVKRHAVVLSFLITNLVYTTKLVFVAGTDQPIYLGSLISAFLFALW